jgi:flagellar basal-body rod protein FlgB
MSTENMTLFRALGAKMDYLNQRQRVLSQNISNADTPGYKPQDLVKVDFGDVLKNVTQGNGVRVQKTAAQHITPGGDIDDPQARKMRKTYDVAPTGNAVIMEEQLINAQSTVMDYNLMTSLYQKNIGMIKMALGSA